MENEKKLLDGSLVVSEEEAKRLLKEHDNKVTNGSIDAFVSLKDINKIYPNGVQAVYDFNIDIQEHEFIVLVGPSGCGKSTTLRMVAGLEDITSGYLYINKVLSNYLASKDRDISMVFQSYALYPQMTVYDNIAFPLKIRKFDAPVKAELVEACDQAIKALDNADLILSGVAESADKSLNFSNKTVYLATKLNISDLAAKLLLKDINLVSSNPEALKEKLLETKEKEVNKLTSKGYEINEKYELVKNGVVEHNKVKYSKEDIRRKVFEAARILDLGPYLDRRPRELSGGQMQRVALGRAIVRNAKLFLMDEPLSNLDAKLRVAMRSEIVRLHEQIGATTIYVTHDQTEAMTMATRIAVMSKGWVQQIGTPQVIYNHPKNIFVATFIGAPAMNIFTATYNKGVVTFADGYQLKLSKEFVKTHDKFYEERIADCKRMLETNDFKKMHALDIYQALEVMNVNPYDEEFLNKLDDLRLVVETIDDEHGQEALNLLDEIDILLQQGFKASAYTKLMHKIKEHLVTIAGISSEDLRKLHNAQVFNKNEKPKEEVLVYKKRKDKQKKAKKISFNVNNLTFSNNLYTVCVNLLAEYEKALAGEHLVSVGVRPENIHLDNEYSAKNKTDAFNVVSDVVELMGSEILIHADWNGVDMIAKISTGTLVKPHETVALTLNGEKIHLFDYNSGDTIEL